MTQDRRTLSARVGGYTLESDPEDGSFAQFEPEQERKNAEALRAALDQPEEKRTPVVALEEFEASASSVTGRIEQANGLFRAAAEGRLLEPDVLTSEVDVLLDVLTRLDRAGRFQEELRLLRALHGLLVLAQRWLDLVRSLRTLLRSAQNLQDAAGEAWARHELGSLHLAAGQPEKAAEHLRKAIRIEEALGTTAGRCATRHNLDAAERDIAFRQRIGGPTRRLLRLAGLVAVLALIGAGGASAWIFGGGDDHPPPAPPPPPPPTTTLPPPTTTSPPPTTTTPPPPTTTSPPPPTTTSPPSTTAPPTTTSPPPTTTPPPPPIVD